jgi:transposase InsO family protein
VRGVPGRRLPRPTLVAVDVATTWTELQAVWGRHHRRVTSGIPLLHQRLPVPLRAGHSDNGGSNGEIFYSLKEAQIVIEQWRVQDNTRRPHASLGYRPPAQAAYHPVISTNVIPESLVVM